jgi:hypothetical protein
MGRTGCRGEICSGDRRVGQSLTFDWKRIPL